MPLPRLGWKSARGIRKLALVTSLTLLCASPVFYLLSRPQAAQARTLSSQDSQDKAKSDTQDKAKSDSQAPPATAGYVGLDACKTCHEDLYNGYEKTAHWKTTLDTRGGPSHQGCEACHGPGSQHVDNPGDPTKIFDFKTASAKAVNERCMTCHASGKEQMNFSRSVHSHNGVSCLDCHSPHHAPRDAEFLLVKAQPDLCYTCHQQQKPQFAMPFHHRVNEHLVQCSDCHNPHGTVEAKQIRTSVAEDAACFKCHAEKRGPFVFEHEPVKVEGCVSCHTPHGSPNPHLLKVSNVNLLCLSCHTISFANAPGTPSFHNQAAQYQACTMCHSAIHGSNFDHFFFK